MYNSWSNFYLLVLLLYSRLVSTFSPTWWFFSFYSITSFALSWIADRTRLTWIPNYSNLKVDSLKFSILISLFSSSNFLIENNGAHFLSLGRVFLFETSKLASDILITLVQDSYTLGRPRPRLTDPWELPSSIRPLWPFGIIGSSLSSSSESLL